MLSLPVGIPVNLYTGILFGPSFTGVGAPSYLLLIVPTAKLLYSAGGRFAVLQTYENDAREFFLDWRSMRISVVVCFIWPLHEGPERTTETFKLWV